MGNTVQFNIIFIVIQNTFFNEIHKSDYIWENIYFKYKTLNGTGF